MKISVRGPKFSGPKYSGDRSQLEATAGPEGGFKIPSASLGCRKK